jgi:uncharacterized protein (UPF0333 family)
LFLAFVRLIAADRHGQALTEYGLLLILVVVAAVAAMAFLGEVAGSLIDRILTAPWGT